MQAAASRVASDSRQLGIYLQDHIKFDQRWVMLAGGRWDKAKIDNRNTSVAGIVSKSKVEADAFTRRVGLLYLSDRGIAPYLSYSESFQPAEGADFLGRAFIPTEGVQYEAGVKFEPKSRNAALTVSAYELTQQNVLTPDPAHPGFAVQTGEIRARGVEVEGRVAFGDHLDLLASYSPVDAKVTKTNGTNLGFTPTSVPKSTASLWADYHYRVTERGELSLGAGARRVGVSRDVGNLLTIPTYTDYDFSARLDLEKWRFALNVKNILDTEYVAACTFTCFYGEARNVTFSAQYSW